MRWATVCLMPFSERAPLPWKALFPPYSTASPRRASLCSATQPMSWVIIALCSCARAAHTGRIRVGELPLSRTHLPPVPGKDAQTNLFDWRLAKTPKFGNLPAFMARLLTSTLPYLSHFPQEAPKPCFLCGRANKTCTSHLFDCPALTNSGLRIACRSWKYSRASTAGSCSRRPSCCTRYGISLLALCGPRLGHLRKMHSLLHLT